MKPHYVKPHSSISKKGKRFQVKGYWTGGYQVYVPPKCAMCSDKGIFYVGDKEYLCRKHWKELYGNVSYRQAMYETWADKERMLQKAVRQSRR